MTQNIWNSVRSPESITMLIDIKCSGFGIIMGFFKYALRYLPMKDVYNHIFVNLNIWISRIIYATITRICRTWLFSRHFWWTNLNMYSIWYFFEIKHQGLVIEIYFWDATGMSLVNAVYNVLLPGDPANTCGEHGNTTGKPWLKLPCTGMEFGVAVLAKSA